MTRRSKERPDGQDIDQQRITFTVYAANTTSHQLTMPAISIMLSAFIPAKTVFPLSIDEIDHNSQELSKLPLRANLGPYYQATISAETN